MAYTGRFGQSDDFRREELIRIIEHSVENLTLQELEALYARLIWLMRFSLSMWVVILVKAPDVRSRMPKRPVRRLTIWK